ncbi:hypothetical protein [Halococcus saccharolyticus]|uniref:hypothetical protein n=1 Tax=Halococcus saccharolyticus TaxID=62319 RepID=UPI001267747B|nr:hypothetical protein [Halococcus saccharolyticus]
MEHLVEQSVDQDARFLNEKDEAKRHLDMLVEYELVNHDDGQYWVHCLPGEDLSAWRERTRSPEAIYRLVQQANQQRERESQLALPETFEYGNEKFVSVPADENTDKMDLASVVAKQTNRSSTFDGIVVRSPADQIGYIQQLADELCDAEAMGEADLPYYFEKVASNIRGEHKDNLEYHLYLRSVL